MKNSIYNRSQKLKNTLSPPSSILIATKQKINKLLEINKKDKQNHEKNENKENLQIEKIKLDSYLISHIFFRILNIMLIKIMFIHANNNKYNEYSQYSVIIFIIGVYKIIFSLLFMNMEHLNFNKSFNHLKINNLMITTFFNS